MGEHTILNVKMDKQLKAEAKKVAEELGIPLSTAVNAFLKQFVREKEITLSANEHRPSKYLQDRIEEARVEYERGESTGPMSKDKLIKHLRSL